MCNRNDYLKGTEGKGSDLVGELHPWTFEDGAVFEGKGGFLLQGKRVGLYGRCQDTKETRTRDHSTPSPRHLKNSNIYTTVQIIPTSRVLVKRKTVHWNRRKTTEIGKEVRVTVNTTNPGIGVSGVILRGRTCVNFVGNSLIAPIRHRSDMNSTEGIGDFKMTLVLNLTFTNFGTISTQETSCIVLGEYLYCETWH